MYDYVGTDAHKVAHLENIKEIKVKKKHLPAIEKLLEKHKAAVNYS
jgi:protein-tyrosine phosphatase